MYPIRMMKTEIKNRKTFRVIVYILTAIYALFMIYLMFIRNRWGISFANGMRFAGRINVIPFRSVYEYISVIMTDAGTVRIRNAVVNLMGNIIMFIPFGFLIPQLFRNRIPFEKMIAVMAAAVSSAELLQLLTGRGCCDIDDLLLNLAGAAVGYALFSISGSIWHGGMKNG